MVFVLHCFDDFVVYHISIFLLRKIWIKIRFHAKYDDKDIEYENKKKIWQQIEC